MDDVFDSLLQFQKSLESFNNRLRSSFEDLNNKHEIVNAHWQDSMRKDYDVRWLNLKEKMRQYMSVDGNSYTDMLLYRLNVLSRYLYGN